MAHMRSRHPDLICVYTGQRCVQLKMLEVNLFKTENEATGATSGYVSQGSGP